MAAAPCASIAKPETQFDYEGVKKKYMKQIEMYYFNRKLAVIAPRTRKVIDKIKSIIKEGIRLQEIGYPSKLPKYNIMHKYEIITENGEEKLIYKRRIETDRIIQVVAAEDCFDIIADAHLKTEHGGHEKVMKILRLKYTVPKTSIDFILASCNVCLANNNTEFRRRADNRIPQVFHTRGQVSLIDMTSEPDHQFHYILLYLDRFTKYMLLRPLVTNSENEVAMELLKIFLDIGPPEKLETYDRVFFAKVLSLVHAAYAHFKISLIIPVRLPEIGVMYIRKGLKKWQEESGSRNWAMGCYVIQWESNCTPTIDRRSPYQSVFKLKPWHSIQAKSDSLDKQGGSKNDATIEINDSDSVEALYDGLVKTDSEDNASNASEVAEITEENGELLASIPLKPTKENKASNALLTARLNTPGSVNRFIIEQPKEVNSNSTLISGDIPTQPGTTSCIDDIPASTIVKKPRVENSKCHICKTFISKPYVCTKCYRPVHLFCSDRLMKQDVPLDVLEVTCTACRLSAKRSGSDGSESFGKKKKTA